MFEKQNHTFTRSWHDDNGSLFLRPTGPVPYVDSSPALYHKCIGEGGQVAHATLQKWRGTSGCVPPTPLLDNTNVLISLFAYILWLKRNLSKFPCLASLTSFN